MSPSTNSRSAPVNRRWWALAVIASGQLMVVFDVTIMNVALPSISQALTVPAADRHWPITAYTLAFAGLLLLGGRIADRIGRKPAFLIALVGFALASAVGGMAANLAMLVAARAGQGAFGALLAPTALSLVAATFPDPRERGRAFAVFGVVMGGGSGVGLVLGGLLTEYLSWHWVMYLNAPLALSAALGAALVLADSRSTERPRLDPLGAVLSTTALVTLVYGLSSVATHGWSAPLTLAALATSLLATLAFVAIEARVGDPLLPLRILAHRTRGGAYLAFVLVMIGMFGMFLLVSFYLQTVAGYTALRTGLAFLPFAAAVLITSVIAGRLTVRLRPGPLLSAGLLLAAAGTAWLTRLGVDSGYAGHILPALVLFGAGLGTISPIAANLSTMEVADRETGVASAVFNASEQVGASLGLALMSTIAATGTTAYLAAHPHDSDLAAVVHGYTTATAWAAGILATGALGVLILLNAPSSWLSGVAVRSSVSVRRILRLFRPHRGTLTTVALLVGMSSLVSVASPFLLREVLDTAIPQRRLGLLSLLIGGMIAVSVATNAMGVAQTYLSTRVGQSVMHHLRADVYARLQRMSPAFYTRTRTGEIQSRIANDIGGMQATVTSTATSLVSNLTTVVATVIAMLALDWRLTIVSLLLLPLFVAVSRRVGAERKTITARRQSHLATMSADVQESLSISGILLGRTTGQARALTDAFTARSATLAELEVSSSMTGRWRMAGIQIVMTALPALIYFYAGATSALGIQATTLGTLVAFATLQQTLFRPLLSLLATGVDLQSSLALFGRIFEYLDLPIDIAEPAHPTRLPRIRGEVTFTDVAFAYEGGRPTLTGINLTVPTGTSLAVVGETGSGKTTLSYLVARLYDVTSGSVRIDGVDVRDLSLDTLAAAVGVVSQEPYLLHASVADNLRFAKPDATDDALVQAAKAAQIHDHITRLPDGYDTLVGERGHRFSGGEKQRLAIARTILRNPPILILDEATSALDTETEHAVQQALTTLSAGRTTLTIAHRLSTIEAADQIVVLADGRIAERGTHDELLALGGRYAALLGKGAPAALAA